MKSIISDINKLFENRIRLGIMSILSVNQDMSFNSLKEILDITDGNLASHLKALEKNNYLAVTKQFIGRKPNTSYRITDNGRKAFQDHIKALEALLKNK